MKAFLIVVLIFLSMYLVKDFFDNRGFCYSHWTYHAEERLDNMLNGMIDDFIEHDKVSRSKWLKIQGYDNDDINRIMQNLEKIYLREKEKFLKSCYINFEEIYYPITPNYSLNEKYCRVGSNHDSGEVGSDYLAVSYKFDKESYAFFNEIPYVRYATGGVVKMEIKSFIFGSNVWDDIHHTNYYGSLNHPAWSNGIEEIGKPHPFDRKKEIKFYEEK